MKQLFEITDKTIIKEVLDNAQYGTLAICSNNKPYSLPINFVEREGAFYFHGSSKGRKIDILKQNQWASFSVVEDYSLIQSYFSSTDGLACPATHFFKSVIVDGQISFVDSYKEKVAALSALMEKLQEEGKYKPLEQDIYKKSINATTVYRLTPDTIKAKFKFGQHLSRERFEMIIDHLKKRGSQKDWLNSH